MGAIFFILITATVLFALWRILPRAGLSPFFSLVALIPFVGLPGLLLWIAIKPWPGDKGYWRVPQESRAARVMRNLKRGGD
ncbi:MAG: hypothetical protein AAFR84_12080 [Pseudomonadota bacterium]